jgi:hypothetical protein
MGVLSNKEEKELLQKIEGIERIEKEVSLSWDGRNLMLRLPKDISGFLELNEKNRHKKSFKFIIEAKDGKVEKKFDIVDKEDNKGVNKKWSTKSK